MRRVYRMPFGSYRGVALCDLPLDYLMWLLSLDNLHDPLLSALEEEYRRRSRRESHRGNHSHDVRTYAALPEPVKRAATQIVDAGFRTMCHKTHPDAGGDPEQQILLNQAAEFLREFLREQVGAS